ncbi:Ribosomal-L7Ae domain-containing protein [Aphelenchoides besseyi]|nr:Ribosomal-L7Ae domain-containing protein [Aphelenchoides besseyi]
MGKPKVEVKEEVDEMDVDTSTTASTVRVPAVGKEEYAQLVENLNPIASPVAGRKTAKKIYKLLQQAKNNKNSMRQGLSEVMKGFRKNETGLVIMAGDVWPIDMYSHIPGICEEREIPYVYTPSRHHLGLAVGFTRPMIVILLKRADEYGELFDEVAETAKAMDLALG